MAQSTIQTVEPRLQIIEQMFPKTGDTFGTAAAPYSCMCFGVVTSSAQQIWLSIPVSLWVDETINMETSQLTYFYAAIRIPTGGYIIGNMVDLSSYVTQFQLRSKGRGFYMTLTKSDGWDVTNNIIVNGSCQIGVTF